MDSDPCISQPTQLLQHALAPPVPQNGNLDSPRDDCNLADNLSLDTRVIAVRSETPRYDFGERVLAEEIFQRDGEVLTASPADEDGSGSARSIQLRGDSPISASLVKVIGTKAAPYPFSPPTPSMPVDDRRYRRSPSPASQDSFAGPISQDPAERYLASTKQFDVPLSDLGETPTQEVIHSHTDPGLTLPDASEHKEFLEAAMREYDAQRANRLASNRHPNVLVVASPDESSGTPQHTPDDFSFNDDGPDDESRFQFGGLSSFDKMLNRGLGDAPDPTPEPAPIKVKSAQAASLEHTTKDDFPTTPPRTKQRTPTPPFDFDWTAHTPSAAVASSNPRSLLRMVHPNNQYRIAKMQQLAGNVDPPSCLSTRAEAQPSRLQETQPCYVDELAHLDALPPTRPTIHQTRTTRPSGRRPQVEEEPEDALDIVPDSEPGPSTESPAHDRAMMQSPLKKAVLPPGPMSKHGLADLVPDSLEAEESEADVPLAIEVASRQPKKYAHSTEHVTVHARDTRSAHSAKNPTQALERQPPRPTSSRTTGKNSRVKASKSEAMEVPTSLPEQDLPDQAVIAAANMPPSKNKTRRPETLEPPRANTNSATYSTTIKSVGGNKRSRKYDTESSEDTTRQPTKDERLIKGKMRKEEEEESGSTDDHAESPPPPLKSETSRKKRRRIEDMNRGLPKAPTSRNKPSETPAVATRSAKRLRSGVSSVRGPTTDSATRVFALWKQDGHYYSGVIHSRGPRNKYLVRFDDGTEDEVELKNMRRRDLLVGDRVIIIQDNIKAVVSDVNHTGFDGTFIADTNNGVQTLEYREIRIANRTIQSQWKERTVPAESVVTVVRPKPLVDTTPSKQSVAGMTSGQVQGVLVKTGFVVTINPKNEEPVQTKEKAMRAIKQHGGLVIEDWSSVFAMEGRHSHSNKRWTATPQDFRWKSEVNLDRVFLLSDDAHQKPKFLLALALGIPCLSFEWLTRGEKFSSDWQPFLLPAGYSDTLGARISQLIDLDWGNCTEHLTDIMESEVPIKLFSQKAVLCVGADLVPLPPNRARKGNGEEASRHVPWIILCMGAAKVEAVTDIKQVNPAYLQGFDYIIVKERDVLGSLKVPDKVVVGDVAWVKECLVSSRLSLPKVD